MNSAKESPDVSVQSATRRVLHRTDTVITLCLIALCAWMYYLTTTFDEVPAMLGENTSPEFFPRLILWFIVLLALAMPFEHLYPGMASRLDRGRSTPVARIVYLTVVVLALIVASIPIVGVTLTLFIACLVLPLLWGERRFALVIGYALIFPILITLLFSKVLKVYFYGGLIGFQL